MYVDHLTQALDRDIGAARVTWTNNLNGIQLEEKGKPKLFHYTPWRRLAVDEVSGQIHAPHRDLAPGKRPPVPIV
jgi:hypothetical protein